MQSSDIISALALIVSLLAMLYTMLYNRKLLKHQFWSSSEALYVQLEQTIAKSPEILRFHGVEDDVKERYGISLDEFRYGDQKPEE